MFADHYNAIEEEKKIRDPEVLNYYCWLGFRAALTTMSSNEVFQTQLCTIMDIFVESAVREVSRLLDECFVAVMENEENSLLKREMTRVNKTNTVSASINCHLFKASGSDDEAVSVFWIFSNGITKFNYS